MEAPVVGKKQGKALLRQNGESWDEEEGLCPCCGQTSRKANHREFLSWLIIVFLLGAATAMVVLKSLHWLNLPIVHLSIPANQM
jgi:hypothetical protein